jgi:hypothetical protein
MNKRLEELALQAYRYASNASKVEPHKCAAGSDYFLALERQKFAELIIADCLSVHDCITTEHWTSDGVLHEVERIIKKQFDITD